MKATSKAIGTLAAQNLKIDPRLRQQKREREQRLVNPATSPVIVVVKLESQPDIRSIFFLFSAVIIDCKTDFDSSLNQTTSK